jgi:hypothetical protein
MTNSIGTKYDARDQADSLSAEAVLPAAANRQNANQTTQIEMTSQAGHAFTRKILPHRTLSTKSALRPGRITAQ